jgi:hypothetical protein
MRYCSRIRLDYSLSFANQQLILQKKILARMFELGMTPGANDSLTSSRNFLPDFELLSMVEMAKVYDSSGTSESVTD